MGNVSTKINLAAFAGASIIKSGKNKDVDCIIIPIEMNHFFKSEKGAVYLELIGFEIAADKRKADSKDTHLVKQSLSKEIQAKQTEDEKKNMPILGNHVVWDESGSRSEATPTIAASEDDLPF